MRYWWVNQNQTYAHEIGGGYLWSPKRRSDGAFNHFYDTMRIVAPGDLVLSFRNQHIYAVGVVRGYCYESPKPTEFGNAGSWWSAIGWRVDVDWTELQHRIRPKSHIAQLRGLLPDRYSPLRPNGDGLQSVYLTGIPQPMMLALASLIGYEVLTLMQAQHQQVQPGVVRDQELKSADLKRRWEDDLETEIRDAAGIAETEKEALVKSRRGQGVFRSRVFAVEQRCRITHVGNETHLIASHCKPWRHCTNEERLNGENGLMLTPSIDHLFDRGFISFEDNGRLLVSPVADQQSLARMGVEVRTPVNVGSFSSGQRQFLDFHRNEIFLETR